MKWTFLLICIRWLSMVLTFLADEFHKTCSEKPNMTQKQTVFPLCSMYSPALGVYGWISVFKKVSVDIAGLQRLEKADFLSSLMSQDDIEGKCS